MKKTINILRQRDYLLLERINNTNKQQLKGVQMENMISILRWRDYLLLGIIQAKTNIFQIKKIIIRCVTKKYDQYLRQSFYQKELIIQSGLKSINKEQLKSV